MVPAAVLLPALRWYGSVRAGAVVVYANSRRHGSRAATLILLMPVAETLVLSLIYLRFASCSSLLSFSSITEALLLTRRNARDSAPDLPPCASVPLFATTRFAICVSTQPDYA